VPLQNAQFRHVHTVTDALLQNAQFRHVHTVTGVPLQNAQFRHVHTVTDVPLQRRSCVNTLHQKVKKCSPNKPKQFQCFLRNSSEHNAPFLISLFKV